MTGEPSAREERSPYDWRRKINFDALFAVATVAIVVAGILERSRGVIAFPFWLDECSWANFLMGKPLVELLIRPIGFMALSKGMAIAFGPSAVTLRSVSWVAGVATTVLAPFLARRLFSTKTAQLLFVAAVALNSEAIDHAKEFKPYSLGLFLHFSVLFLTLRYLTTARTRDLRIALVVMVAAVLFTQDIVFAYPGTLLAIAIFAARQRRWPDVVATALAGATALSLIVLQYVFIWSKLDKGESGAWGHKYHVFFTGRDTGGAWLAWAFPKYMNLAAFPGITRGQWHAAWLMKKQLALLVSVSWFAWVTLHVLGVLWIISRKRVSLGLLLLLPLPLMAIMNRAGFWPFGAFRTNLFTLPYTSAIAAAAFDWAPAASSASLDPSVQGAATPTLRGRFRAFHFRLRAFVSARPSFRWLAFVPALSLVVVPAMLFYDGWQHVAHPSSHALRMPEVIAQLVELQGEPKPPVPELLILDERSCDPWNYYTKYDPSQVAAWGTRLQGRFRVVCATKDRAAVKALKSASTGERVWTSYVSRFARDFPRFQRQLGQGFRIEKRARVGASITVEATRPQSTEDPDEVSPSSSDSRPTLAAGP